jgi:hypothetical protein
MLSHLKNLDHCIGTQVIQLLGHCVNLSDILWGCNSTIPILIWNREKEVVQSLIEETLADFEQAEVILSGLNVSSVFHRF